MNAPSLATLCQGLIAAVCLLLPALLAARLRGRREPLPARPAVLLLGGLGVLLGIGHLLGMAAAWFALPAALPVIWNGLTAAGAVVTAIVVVRQLPTLLALRSAEDLALAQQRLREETAARELAEEEMRAAIAKMDRAVRELEQFAYITSHDLQTPLRTIAGFSQLLTRRYRERLDGDALEFLEYIDKGTRQMTRQIQDLLTLSRVGRVGATQIERKPLAEALAKAIRMQRAAIDGSGAEIASGTLPEVEASHELLAQLLAQLIDNAIKFARPGERPKIHIDIARDGDFWVLTVADNGIGIPADQLEAVFAIFRKLQAPEAHPGTGMGLPICRKIAEFHGGTIHATADERGAQLHVRLPVAVARPRAAGSPSELRGV